MKITARTLELTYAIPDMAVIEGFYTAADTLEDDLAEYFELPEIPLILDWVLIISLKRRLVQEIPI